MPVRGDNSLFFATGFDNSGLAAGSTQAVGIVQQMAASISKINPFIALSVGAVAVFATITSEALAFAKKYEVAMLEVRTISAATRADFGQIKDSIFQLSKKTLDDPIKLAQAYYQVVSAGYDGAEGLKLLEVASKAATAGVTDTQTAADGITTVLNAFGKSAEEADRVADAMFKTVELGKTNFSQLASTLSNVAPLAAALGVSYNEVLAAVASLTKQGVPTAQAMTQVRAALIGVNDELGDGWANAYTLQDAFVELERRAGGSTIKLKDMIGRIEGVGAILATTGKNAQGAADDLGELTNAAGAAGRATEGMLEGSISQATILKNNIRAATYELGEYALAISKDVLTGLNRWIRDENEVSSAMEKTRLKLRQLTGEILSNSTSEEDRITLIKEAQRLSPETLGDLDAEKVSYDQLKAALSGANNELRKQIILRRILEEKVTFEERIADNLSDQGALYDQMYQKAIKLEESYSKQGAAINTQLGPLEQVQDLVNQIFKIRKDTGEKTLGVAVDELASLSNQLDGYSKLTDQITAYSGELDKIDKRATQVSVAFGLDGNEDDLQTELQKTVDQIAKITNISNLQDYLNSENKAIREAAEDRKKALIELFGNQGPEADPDKDFAKSLTAKKKEYDAYEASRIQLGEDTANEIFKNLLSEGENYKSYLEAQLNTTKEFAKQRAIALEAQKSGFILGRADVEKVDIAEDILQGVNTDINFIVKVDSESINVSRTKLQRLSAALDAATTDTARERIRTQIDAEKEILANLQGSTDLQKQEYDRLLEVVQGYSLKELAVRLSAQRAVYREQKKLYGKNSKEALAALGEVKDSEEKFAQTIDQRIGDISGMFTSLAGAFRAFGNEELAVLGEQLAGVAQGVGDVAKGFATGNPFAIIGGLADIAKAAITIDIVSDTSKFERAIERLEKSVERLDYVISQSIGNDKIQSRQDAIDQLAELEKQANLAREAEEKARKEVRFLGIRVGDKGEGSGTDPEKLEELENAAEQARRKVRELNEEIDELFTGTTKDTILDSIISGFEEGKRSAEDFAETFEDLMRGAMLEALKIQFLEKAIDAFFKDFANKSESDGGLTTAEISELRNSFNQLVQDSNTQLENLNEVLGAAGVEAIGFGGAEERQGLSAGISTITEDTANVLAGTLNAIRLDVRTGLDAAEEANIYLAAIRTNTGVMVDLITEGNIKLSNIEKGLS